MKQRLQKTSWVSFLLTGALCAALIPAQPAYAEDIPLSDKEKDGWTLVFQEEFNDPVLDPSRFSDSYLPHWTTTEQSLAHYTVSDGVISLNIEKDGQGPWWADAGVQKVSSIQTGMRDGLHRFWDSCTILDHHRAVTNFETKYGYFELRARVPDDGGLHTAWWMLGTETRPNETGEIDIFEICGPDCRADKSRVRVSVHPWEDTGLKEQSLDYYPSCNVSDDFHVYGFEWQPDGMKFYFDGELVKETSQSPNYKMITLLGIYENNAPFWSGTPDYTSEYPKRFEIDYFRVYKTEEMLAQEREETVSPAAGENIAPYAVAGAGQDWAWNSPPSNLIDNNAYSAMQSNEAPAFPQYLYLDWEDTQTFDTVVMKAAYGQRQAPTSWAVEISADGETGWTEVASSKNAQWQGDDWHVEEKTLTFPQVYAKAVRIRIDSAALYWNHYAINEIQVWDSSRVPVHVNIAAESTSEWNSENGGQLTDKNFRLASQSKDRPAFPEPITLRWSRPVSLNRIDLSCWYAGSQAPTALSVEVSPDGENWREILSPTELTWKTDDTTIEKNSLLLPTVSDIRYLRLQIHDASLRWRHFAINELEVFLDE